jgi:hypothetical protein
MTIIETILSCIGRRRVPACGLIIRSITCTRGPRWALATSEHFQLWKLKVGTSQTATLTCEDGNGKAVYSKAIKHTDFPLPEIALYSTNNVILLPSEN